MGSATGKGKPPARNATGPPKNGARVRLFTFLALLVPVALLVLLELGLRWAHFAAEYDLVHKRTLAGEPYYVLNRHVARRYFSFTDVAIPDARDAVFRVHKRPNGLRIFCLGGSTTAGFPYTFNATFPSLLQDRLESLFPDRDIEVVNVGISAISSYSVLDFVRELVHYQPDLFVIYMGHNEFYGALGVASSQSFGKNRWVKLLFLRLQRLKLFQLVRLGVEDLRRVLHKGGGRDVTLMEVMARKKAIRLGDPDYQRALSDFRANLDAIVSMAQKHGSRVLLSTLVSNLRDQHPFVSLFSESTSAPERVRIRRWLAEADSLLTSGQFSLAVAKSRMAVKADPGYAAAPFALGRGLYGLGQYDSARTAFVKARDLDALRFRASSDFNRVIFDVARQRRVPVVRMDSVFAAHSPHGVVGHELLLEHLHPNFEGYFLMAKAFTEGIREHGLLVPTSKWPVRRVLPDSVYFELAGVTPLDLALADLRIRRLTSHWPFNGKTVTKKIEVPAFVERVARMVYTGRESWNQGHYDVAAEYIRQHRYREAEREYRAVIKVVPTDFFPYLKLADLKLAQGQVSEAEELYSRALVLSRRLPFAYAKLGTLRLMQGRPGDALPLLRKAAALASGREDFRREDKGRLHYALAVALAQTGDREKALAEAKVAGSLLPGDPAVKQLLKQLGTK